MRFGSDSSMSTSKRYQRLLRKLERGHSLLAGDRGKVIEELLEGVTSLEVVDEVLERYAGTRENDRASLNLGIRRDDLIHGHE